MSCWTICRIHGADMATGRWFLRSTIFLLVYVYLCLNEVSITSYSQLSADLTAESLSMDIFRVVSEIFHFQLGPLGHVEEDTYRLVFHYIQTMRPVLPWQEFQLAEAFNLIQALLLSTRLLHCAPCVKELFEVITGRLNVMCVNNGVTSNVTFNWTSPSCISTLRILPLADISNLDSSDGSFTSNGESSRSEPVSQQTLATDDYLEILSRILNYSSKDLKVAHLNICSLRYKIDELRLLQRICGFDILGISETHLDSSVPDNFLQIDGF